jgi:hypothetical protein
MSSIVFISAKFQCIYLEWTWEIAKLRVAKKERTKTMACRLKLLFSPSKMYMKR